MGLLYVLLGALFAALLMRILPQWQHEDHFDWLYDQEFYIHCKGSDPIRVYIQATAGDFKVSKVYLDFDDPEEDE